MITLRPSNARGRTKIDWLDSYHSFAFGQYRDPEWRAFRSLRVINDDIIAPGGGFPTHPHRDMEIITYVLDGALRHEDSSGGGGTLRHGDVQRMSAGSGITHSEVNASDTDPVRLIQIWIEPREKGMTPRYDDRTFEITPNTLVPIAAGDELADALSINQDGTIYSAQLAEGASITHTLKPGRHAWLQVARGTLTLNGQTLSTGDGAAISEETVLTIAASSPAEFLLFDLA